MNRIAILAALTAALAGCSGSGVPASGCKKVADTCTADADCCSYGCVAGKCACNPDQQGVCATSADCCSGLACQANHCLTGCRGLAEACTGNGDCCTATGVSCGNTANGKACCESRNTAR